MNATDRDVAPSSPQQDGPLWISVDGVECAGKTSLSHRLQTLLDGSRILPEFSTSPVGVHLRRSVQISPHFISPSLVGQSLLFLADYADIAHAATTTSDRSVSVVIQDRGYLSKWVYQFLVLQEELGGSRARALLEAIMAELPRPDITVYLDASMSLIESRLQAARPDWLTPDRRTFVEGAIHRFREQLDDMEGMVVHVSQDPQDSVDDTAHLVTREVARAANSGRLGRRLPEGKPWSTVD
jgi:thymidylate kinase